MNSARRETEMPRDLPIRASRSSSCNVNSPRPCLCLPLQTSISSLNYSPNWARSFRLEHPAHSSSFRCFEPDLDAPFKMLVQSLSRTARTSTTPTRSCSQKLSRPARSFRFSAYRLAPSFSATHQAPLTSQSQSRQAHAISNPTLAGIEKRWEGMPPQEQAELWMQLRDRMKVDWNEMTLQEKKAGTSLRCHVQMIVGTTDSQYVDCRPGRELMCQTLRRERR
jgi:Cytochrome c oxidase subunit IV